MGKKRNEKDEFLACQDRHERSYKFVFQHSYVPTNTSLFAADAHKGGFTRPVKCQSSSHSIVKNFDDRTFTRVYTARRKRPSEESIVLRLEGCVYTDPLSNAYSFFSIEMDLALHMICFCKNLNNCCNLGLQ